MESAFAHALWACVYVFCWVNPKMHLLTQGQDLLSFGLGFRAAAHANVEDCVGQFFPRIERRKLHLGVGGRLRLEWCFKVFQDALCA